MATKQRIPGIPIRATLTLRKPSPDGGVTPGDVYDLTDYDGYAVYAFVKPNKIIAQFSKNAITGYLDFKDTSDENTGVVVIEIPAAATKGLRDTMIHVIPVVQADDSGSPLPFGPEEGVASELVYITLAPKDTIPDLS